MGGPKGAPALPDRGPNPAGGGGDGAGEMWKPHALAAAVAAATYPGGTVCELLPGGGGGGTPQGLGPL